MHVSLVQEYPLYDYEDYYVKVRGYSTSTTGSYRLYFEKNLDTLVSTTGGEWDQNSGYYNSSYNINNIKYYTAEQVSVYYMMLDEDVRYVVQQAMLDGGIDLALSALLQVVPGLQGWGGVFVGTALGSLISWLLPDLVDLVKDEIFDECGGSWITRNGVSFPIFDYGLKVTDISMTSYDYYSGMTIYTNTLSHSKYTSTTLYGVELDRGTFTQYEND